MDANTRFEIQAVAFFKITGMLPPGKDDALGDYTYEEREAAWSRWRDKNRDLIEAMLFAVDLVVV